MGADADFDSSVPHVEALAGEPLASAGWHAIGELPSSPTMVLYFHGNWPAEAMVSHYRDERFRIGFFDGRDFRESGTGHYVFESWMKPFMPPTHWMSLPAPPASP